MDSKLDVLWNPRPDLSMTRFMLQPTNSLDMENLVGLVLGQEEDHGFTQVVELK